MSTVVQQQVRSRHCAFHPSLIRDVCLASSTSCVLFCVCAIFKLHLNFHNQWKCLVGSARLRKHDEQRVVEATTTVSSTTEGQIQYERLVQMIVKRNFVFDNRGTIKYERLAHMIVKRNSMQSVTGVQNPGGEHKNMDSAMARENCPVVE